MPFRAGTLLKSASATCPPSTLSGWGQAFSPPPHYLSATAYPCANILPFRAGIAALGYCDSLRCASVGPPFLFGQCYSLRPLCPPSTLIGWGQAFSPPPHYLSATAMSSAYHRTSNVQRGLRGVAPPAPPLLRLVCSSSGALTSSALRPAE